MSDQSDDVSQHAAVPDSDPDHIDPAGDVAAVAVSSSDRFGSYVTSGGRWSGRMLPKVDPAASGQASPMRSVEGWTELHTRACFCPPHPILSNANPTLPKQGLDAVFRQ